MAKHFLLKIDLLCWFPSKSF